MLRFTAASERALAHASGWRNQAGCDEISAESLLLGLLAESECRAASLLLDAGVDAASVRERWPSLDRDEHHPVSAGDWKPFSREVASSLELAVERLVMLPQPIELATEHLLLGLTAADHEVALWLQQQGLDPERIEAEICHREGIDNPPQEDDLWDATHHPTNAAAEVDAIAALRAMDAAANRAREGLRVVEDYIRFVLDDRHLTHLCKQLRHDLTSALARIPFDKRLAARETQYDVGTGLTTSREQRRDDASEVLRASFARAQESLRSLEEFAKLSDAALAALFKQLRYRVYTLQRAIEIAAGAIERLSAARLYVLIDGRASAEELERLVRSLGNADIIQLRDKRLHDRELLDRARLLRAMTRQTGTLFIMNDRPDLAALAQADGVHVGQEEVSVKDARSIVGPERLVGVSTHSIEQARQAVLDGANYIGVGPTFASGTKAFDRFPGLELLWQVAAEIRLPAFAIGGIHGGNVSEVFATGFSRIAVSGAILAADDPAAALEELHERLLRSSSMKP